MSGAFTVIAVLLIGLLTGQAGVAGQDTPLTAPEIQGHYQNGPDPDSDGDGVPDTTDNCPFVATPWIVPVGDTDCDGWTDVLEAAIGTDSNDRCANTAGPDNDPLPDAWPVDFNDDNLVTGSDILKLGAPFGTFAPGPPYAVRFDFNLDGVITGSDILKFGKYFGKSCGSITVAVDLDQTGNTATNIGAGGAGIDPGDIQSTVANVAIGSTVTFDIVVDSVPSPGIFGVGLEINYDQNIVEVTAVNLLTDLLQFSSGTADPFTCNDCQPAKDGSFRVDSVDLSGADETGPGKVLSVTVECIATGTTPITLTDLFTGGGDFAGILKVGDGLGANFTNTELEASISCG